VPFARSEGWKLQIMKIGQQAFKITGLTRMVERSFAWLGRDRRFSKDYERPRVSPKARARYQRTREGFHLSETHLPERYLVWLGPVG
jgi:hypothetical protein